MIQYADLPGELRLKIMEVLIDSTDKRSLYSLLSSSPDDLRLFTRFRQPLLRRLANAMFDAIGTNAACRRLALTSAVMLARRHEPPFNRQFYDFNDINTLYHDMFIAPGQVACMDNPASLGYLLRLLSTRSLRRLLDPGFYVRPPTHLNNPKNNVRWAAQVMRVFLPWWWTWTETQAFSRTFSVILEQQVLQ